MPGLQDLFGDPQLLQSIIQQISQGQQGGQPTGGSPQMPANVQGMIGNPQQTQQAMAPPATSGMMTAQPPKQGPQGWDQLSKASAQQGQPWDIRHPLANSFLQGLSQGFSSKLAPGAFQAQKEGERQKQSEDFQLQREKIAQALADQHDKEKEQLKSQQEAQKQQLDLFIRGGQQVSPVPSGQTTVQNQLGMSAPGIPALPQDVHRMQGGLQAPPNSFQIGDQLWTLPPDKDTTNKNLIPIAPESDIAKNNPNWFKGAPKDENGQYLIHPQVLPFIADRKAQQEKQDAIKANSDELDNQFKTFTKEINSSALPKADKDIYLESMQNAMRSDKRIGNTTQTGQVYGRLQADIRRFDPDTQKALLDQETAKAQAVGAAGERGRVSANPDYQKPDPSIVKSAADQVLMNGDNLDYVTKLSGGDKGFERAVRDEILTRGVSFQKLSAQARESRDYAQIADKELGPLMTKVDALGKLNQLGPWAGRLNAFMQGKVGSTDPEYAQLSGEVDLMRKLVGKIHLGVRGAGSPANAEMMKQKVDEGKMDATTLNAGLKAYKTYIDYYKQAGIRSKEEVQGGVGGNVPDFIVVNDKVVPNPAKKGGQ